MARRERETQAEDATGRRVAQRRFFTHAAVYVAVNLMLFVVDLAGGGGWWFFWPLLGWGIGLAAQAANAFGGAWRGREGSESSVPLASAARSGGVTAPAVPTEAEQGALADEAETRVARLWRVARRIEAPAARERAFAVCGAADRVAEALAGGAADPATARVFLDRYLAPAEAILERYVRVADRGVTGAQPTLTKVETHDLPLLETRLEELYQQLHRGDVIDLAVASEMLELDLGTAPPRPSARRTP